MDWCYGFVESEKEGLILAEVYFDEGEKPVSYCNVDWKDLKNKDTRDMIIKDLKSQLHYYDRFCFKEKDIVSQEFDLKGAVKTKDIKRKK